MISAVKKLIVEEIEMKRKISSRSYSRSNLPIPSSTVYIWAKSWFLRNFGSKLEDLCVFLNKFVPHIFPKYVSHRDILKCVDNFTW